MLRKIKNEKGFTLVELVVVIAILAVLATLLVPRILGNVQDANRSKEIANARTIASEITTYNALAAPEDRIGPGTITAATELSSIRTGIELPDTSIVQIVVDADGNAYIQEVDAD